MSPALLLFDIDGTLLKTGGMGMAAMYHVAREMFGEQFSWEGIDPSGHLDPLIFAEAAANNRLADHHLHHERFRDQYLECLRQNLETYRHRVEVMPGIHDTLAMLRRRANERGDIVLGLLTGNYTRAVAIKLASIDVAPEWFDITAFGDEGASRPALVELAMCKYADMIGAAPDPRKVIIIGDTPRDVQCAHAHGCVCLAVATGSFSIEQLRAAGADAVVADLRDPGPLLAMIEDRARKD